LQTKEQLMMQEQEERD